MGQHLSSRSYDVYDLPDSETSLLTKAESFPDLRNLPPEIGIKILSNVSAHELRVCRYIWADLASDELLWKRLCYENWSFCTAYKTPRSLQGRHFWKSLFNTLESGTESFNTFITDESNSGLYVLMSMRVLSDEPEDITQFILGTDLLKTAHVVELFRHRYDVLSCYISKHDFTGWFLPIAMRSFFFKLSISMRRLNAFKVHLLSEFSHRYCDGNPSFNIDALLVVVHSLILLSNDLCNPMIKNKMSKREYIKNTLHGLSSTRQGSIDTEFLGHVYDNVYLVGHVAPERLDGL